MTRLGDKFRKGKWAHLKINSTKLQNRFPFKFNLTVSLRFVFHGEEKILNIQDPSEMRVDWCLIPQKKKQRTKLGWPLFVESTAKRPAPWHALLPLLQHTPVPAADWQIGAQTFGDGMGGQRANGLTTNEGAGFPWDNFQNVQRYIQ